MIGLEKSFGMMDSNLCLNSHETVPLKQNQKLNSTVVQYVVQGTKGSLIANYEKKIHKKKLAGTGTQVLLPAYTSPVWTRVNYDYYIYDPPTDIHGPLIIMPKGPYCKKLQINLVGMNLRRFCTLILCLVVAKWAESELGNISHLPHLPSCLAVIRTLSERKVA